MKQLDVQIMGQSYLLGCPEGGEDKLLDAVDKVDNAMCKIRDAGKVKARDRIAVLAALNLAFDVPNAAPPAPPAAPVAAKSAPPRIDNDPQLAALIQRLDQVLGDDGRLL